MDILIYCIILIEYTIESTLCILKLLILLYKFLCQYVPFILAIILCMLALGDYTELYEKKKARIKRRNKKTVVNKKS